MPYSKMVLTALIALGVIAGTASVFRSLFM